MHHGSHSKCYPRQNDFRFLLLQSDPTVCADADINESKMNCMVGPRPESALQCSNETIRSLLRVVSQRRQRRIISHISQAR